MSSAKPEFDDVDLPEGAFDPDAGVDNGAIRIILADSQAVYRVGVRKIFSLEDDIRVIAQVDNLSGLHSAIKRFPTDMILLEWNLIAGSIDTVAELVGRVPQLKIIVHSADNDESRTVEFFRCGVRGIIPRSISPDMLVKCVRKIAAGETWIDNQSINRVIEAYRSHAASLTGPHNRPHLTPKELAIITCICQGKRNKEIAYELRTTEQVIKNYLRKVYDKLGVSDRLELALYCLHHQLHKKAPSLASDGGGSQCLYRSESQKTGQLTKLPA
jgi:two-component system, NarL family, nitrate/nitrite response regulator NarL